MDTSPTGRSLRQLLEALSQVVEAGPDRIACAAQGRERADELGRRLPLVHRTGRRDRPGWRELLSERRLRAMPLEPSRLERRLSWEKVVYFYLGACALERGSVVLLLSRESLGPATFHPFDSGAVASGAWLQPVDDRSWEIADRVAVLSEHLGVGVDLVPFTAAFLAAHFHDPADYVRRGQYSLPDHPIFHGLKSNDGDRRAWTIEVQAHSDVPLEPLHVRRVIVKGSHKEIPVPGPLRDVLVRWSREDGPTFKDFILQQIWDTLP